MNKRLLTIISLASLSSIVIAAGAVFAVKQQKFSQLQKANADYTMILNSTTATGATSEFGNGTFEVSTPSGQSEVEWEFNDAKDYDTGLLTLNKTRLGLLGDDTCYIGNVDPITSISSITVGLGSGDKVLLFASPDGTNYYKMGLITEANATFTLANDYQFFRLVNGYQSITHVNIQSLSITYACNANEDTDEISDITSNNILVTGSVASHTTDSFKNGYKSSQSLKIAADGSSNSADFVIELGRSVPATELGRYNLEFFINSQNTENYDGSHAYTRLLLYPGVNSSRNTNKKYLQTANFNNGQDWTKVTYNLGSITGLDQTETYNSLYIRETYVKGYLLLDQCRIYMNDSYPAIDEDLYNTYEANDLSNTSVVYHYGTVTSGITTKHVSSNSLCASVITIDANYRMWYYSGANTDQDATGTTLSFDIAFDDIPEGKTPHFSYQYAMLEDSELHKYTISNLQAFPLNELTDGVFVSDLGNGFKRYSIDFDANRATLADSTETTTNYGFNVGNASTIYVDNVKVI